MDARVLWQLSYGLYAIGAMDGERPCGCIVNTVFQITSEPATVAVSLNKNNYTMDLVAQTGRFAVSILTEEAERNTIAGLGFRSGRDADKFASVPHDLIDGLPVVKDGVCGYLICEVRQTVDCGTHNVLIAQVVAAETREGAAPMTYKYYHEVIKGKAPKNAPTYQKN